MAATLTAGPIYRATGTAGGVGPRGVPGPAGRSVDLRTVYRRSATAPTISGGTWDGTTYTPPSGWSLAVPSGTALLWAAFVRLWTDPAAIANGAPVPIHVNPDEFADGSLDGSKLKNATVIGAKLANASVDSRTLAANAVTVTAIADDSVTSPKVLAGQVLSRHVAANQIQANHILAGVVEVTHLAAGTLSADNVTAGTMRAAIRMESPDIVAVLSGTPRRFIRLNDGLLAFGDDGRISAAQGSNPANSDYVVVGKYIENADRIAPAWTAETLTAISAISGSIALGQWRSFPASASGKPGTRAGLYVRTGSLSFLAIDSAPALYSGAITGLTGVDFERLNPTQTLRGGPWLFRIGNTLYKSADGVQISSAFMSDLRSGSNVISVAGLSSRRLSMSLAPDYFYGLESRVMLLSNWRGAMIRVISGAALYGYEEHDDEGESTGFDRHVESLVSIETAQPIAAGETAAVRKTETRWAGRPLSNLDSETLIAAGIFGISGTDRLVTIWADGSIYSTASTVTPSNITSANWKGERRGMLSLPSAWGHSSARNSSDSSYGVGAPVALLEVMGNAVAVMPDRSVWTFPLATGTTAVTASNLGTLSLARNLPAIAAWSEGGNTFVVVSDRSVWCAEFTGSSISWTRATTLGTTAPDDDWHAARSERWQSLAVQAQKEYPGTLARNAPIILHTRPDGSQSLGGWDGAAKLWNRPGEGSISGAPLRLVPMADVRGKVGALSVPNPPSSGSRYLRIRLYADGRLVLE